jgi:hypothetical protein
MKVSARLKIGCHASSGEAAIQYLWETVGCTLDEPVRRIFAAAEVRTGIVTLPVIDRDLALEIHCNHVKINDGTFYNR